MRNRKLDRRSWLWQLLAYLRNRTKFMCNFLLHFSIIWMYLPVTLFYILCYGLCLSNPLFCGLCIIFLLRKILFIVTLLWDIHLFKAKDSLRFLRNISKKEYNVTLTFHLSSFEHDVNDLKKTYLLVRFTKQRLKPPLFKSHFDAVHQFLNTCISNAGSCCWPNSKLSMKNYAYLWTFFILRYFHTSSYSYINI